jgi:PAS domain S-box-containing protein
VVLGEYSIDSLLRYGTPTEVLAKYAVTLLDSRNNQCWPAAGGPRAPPAWDVALGQRTSTNTKCPSRRWATAWCCARRPTARRSGVVGSGLFWLVGALSAMTAWMLIATWRHTRRRMQAQQALVAETNFRRAMENSMLTGMRALDMQGRITYVNAAFCQMTGWSEAELVGRTPLPLLARGRPRNSCTRAAGRAERQDPAGGRSVRVKRKDGTLFDARLYVSPLIDAVGKQTGWMTSMTDITEPNRIREQLSASHERFTTVLEALDASVSVAPLGSEELLFANKLYRQWFGTQPQGHLQLVAQAGMPEQRQRRRAGRRGRLMGLPTDTLTSARRPKTPRSTCPSWANGWRCARAT